MKKKFLVFLFLLFLISPKVASAESCETGEKLCSQITSCTPPCEKVPTRTGGPAGRTGAVEAQCACKMPLKEGSVPIGGLCQQNSDCALPGKFCWGEFHQPPTCHEKSRSESLQERQTPFDPTCAVDGDPKGGINTALGCIPANSFNAFIAWLLGNIVFIASGIAFILMLFGAIMILTSAGTPEKVKAGSELITSALAGLVFIILSVFLLNLIGVNILHIPGFGK